MSEPFRVVEPDPAIETAVIVEVPHGGVAVDAASLAGMIAPARAIGRDADLFVDQLFDTAPSSGASFIAANISRYVVDLNRGPLEFDGLAVDRGGPQNLPRGLIWRIGTEGDPILSRRLSQAELERRLDFLYRPYHAALAAMIDAKRKKFGAAILLCAHSMPSQGRRGHVDVGVGRADVVPGTRGRTSAGAPVIDAVDRAARELGFSVKHDDPYKGGFSTGHYGRPSEGVHAIQVELARRLYMDEDELCVVSPGFERTKLLAQALVTTLGKIDISALLPTSSA
jgi:N-formylglutamate deformylase